MVRFSALSASLLTAPSCHKAGVEGGDAIQSMDGEVPGLGGGPKPHEVQQGQEQGPACSCLLVGEGNPQHKYRLGRERIEKDLQDFQTLKGAYRRAGEKHLRRALR